MPSSPTARLSLRQRWHVGVHALATKGYKRSQGLTVEQQNAVDLLVTGATDREVADAVGVNRVTVTRWRNHDPHFQAELNRSRKEIWASSTDRLRGLLPRALDRLESELDEGPNGCKVALALLDITGLDFSSTKQQSLGISGIGSTDPEAIIEARARALRPDPLDELLCGGPVTASERAAAEAELDRLLESS